ncbi:hypothetical protein [Butyrivibrio hungatei]|uniref:Uncharacterized protein n=1 Tax=Butyrivibrio hungatei TaxID=185008 RepID=A0A1D9P5Q5_9FIRM|nr:hypothetical protein [Butyrivibrio hungatei]AOZ97822.1 hypothetical protein bhn_II023 [Butyrivibrio hungatei]
MKLKFKNGNAASRAALISCIVAVGIGFGGIVTSAIANNTNAQVTVSYYTGKPTNPKASYEDAFADGDSAVNRVTYTTKSLGRLQWGEPDSDGRYEVYYDASDVHTMAAGVNDAEARYLELYQKYTDAYKAVME